MARYIDADAYAFPGDLINEPTADVVEVVRCCKCRHSFYISSIDEMECRKHNGCLKHPNDFCSYGERKENND